VESLGYWHSPHTSKERLPILFFHGIGIGLWVYVEYLAALLKTDAGAESGIGIIAVELLPISFRLTTPPPSKVEFLEQITRVLDHHGWGDFALVSHSYGSVLVTHMLSFPALEKRVQAVVLIDPVTIMLHLPDVAFNFTRRLPKEANQWQLWYFASTDPGVAHCLGRHFFWRQNIIWREDLLGLTGARQHGAGRKVAVSLSGRDLITKPGVIAQYLEAGTGGSGEIDVIVFPRLDHAQVFDAAAEREQIVRLTRSYCMLPGADSVVM
jgi:pimeloyl-ACP methyl ester carboxylesterase